MDPPYFKSSGLSPAPAPYEGGRGRRRERFHPASLALRDGEAQEAAGARCCLQRMISTIPITEYKAVCLDPSGAYVFGVHRQDPEGSFFKHVSVTPAELTVVLDSLRLLLPCLYHKELTEKDGEAKIPVRPILPQTETMVFASAGIYKGMRLFSVRDSWRPLDLQSCRNMLSCFFFKGNGLALDCDNLVVFLHPNNGIASLILKNTKETKEVRQFLHHLAQAVFSSIRDDMPTVKMASLIKREVLPHPDVRAFIKGEAKALQLADHRILLDKAKANLEVLSQLVTAFQAWEKQQALFRGLQKKKPLPLPDRCLELLEQAREVKEEQRPHVLRSQERKAREEGNPYRRGNLPQYGGEATPSKYFEASAFEGQIRPFYQPAPPRRRLNFDEQAPPRHPQTPPSHASLFGQFDRRMDREEKPLGPHAELFRSMDSSEFAVSSSSGASSSAPGFRGGSLPYWRRQQLQQQEQQQQGSQEAAGGGGSQEVAAGPSTSQIIDDYAKKTYPLKEKTLPLFGANESFDTQPLFPVDDYEDRCFQEQVGDIHTPSTPDSTSEPSLLYIEESPEEEKGEKGKEEVEEASLSSERLGLNLPRRGSSLGGGERRRHSKDDKEEEEQMDCTSPNTTAASGGSNKENQDPEEQSQAIGGKGEEEEEIVSPAVKRTRRRAALRRQAINAVLGKSRSERLGFLSSSESDEEEEGSGKNKRKRSGGEGELPSPKKKRV